VGKAMQMWRWLWLALLGIPATAGATNGYFAHGYSAAQRAMGGAGTALVEDALIGTINPAGMVWVGERLDVNLGFFSPRRDYTAGPRGPDANEGIFTISAAQVRSENEAYYIPAVSMNWLIDERQSVGIAMYGNGGMNTEYPGNTARFAQNLALRDPSGLVLDVNFETHCQGSFGGGDVVAGAEDQAELCGRRKAVSGVDLIQVFIAPTYALKLGEQSSIGISAIGAGQRFAATGLSAFARFSNAPDKVSDQDHDYSFGYGGRVGVLTGLVPGLGIGASYQTRVKMSRFKKYAGLFADEGGFDIPSSWNLGLSAHLSERQVLAFDYQRIHYSEIRSVGNPMDPNRFVNDCALPVLIDEFVTNNPQYALLVTPPDKDPGACLGAATGPGFGWRDVSIYKIGYQLRLADWRLRAGFSTLKQPIPDSEVLFNVLAPGVVEDHYTAGLSWQFSPRLGFDLALMYASQNPVRGKNPLSHIDATVMDLIGFGGSTEDAFGADPQDQDITLNMRQWEMTFGLSYRFGGE
jgi:long-chain fatty acid transport protein